MEQVPKHSVTLALESLKNAPDEAARRLIHERFWRRLVGLAKAKLGTAAGKRGEGPHTRALGLADEILAGFFHSVESGSWPDLADRSSVWSLLARMTVNRVIDERRRDRAVKRAGEVGESQLGRDKDGLPIGMAAVDDQAAFRLEPAEPSPIETQAFLDLCEELVPTLDEREREVLKLRTAGRANSDIARQFAVSERTVERWFDRIRHKCHGQFWRALAVQCRQVLPKVTRRSTDRESRILSAFLKSVEVGQYPGRSGELDDWWYALAAMALGASGARMARQGRSAQSDEFHANQVDADVAEAFAANTLAFLEELSSQERQLIRLRTEGRTDDEIAEQFQADAADVERWGQAIREKIG